MFFSSYHPLRWVLFFISIVFLFCFNILVSDSFFTQLEEYGFDYLVFGEVKLYKIIVALLQLIFLIMSFKYIIWRTKSEPLRSFFSLKSQPLLAAFIILLVYLILLKDGLPPLNSLKTYLMFYSIFLASFAEQFVFFSAVAFFSKNRKTFLISTLILFVIFISLHHIVIFSALSESPSILDISNQVLAYIFIYFAMVYTCAVKNIWPGVYLHALWNIPWLLGEDMGFMQRYVIGAIFVVLLTYILVFSTKKLSEQSVLLIRVVFFGKIGRAILGKSQKFIQNVPLFFNRNREFNDYSVLVVKDIKAHKPMWKQ